jgi:hypothetical protein
MFWRLHWRVGLTKEMSCLEPQLKTSGMTCVDVWRCDVIALSVLSDLANISARHVPGNQLRANLEPTWSLDRTSVGRYCNNEPNVNSRGGALL